MTESTTGTAASEARAPLVRPWAVIFVGFTGARVLGFLFSVAATRLLPKAEFGSLTYALTIVGLGSVFLSSAPIGLSRYLLVHHHEHEARDAYYTNWLAGIGLLLALSIVAAPLVGGGAGLSVSATAAVALNFVGIAVLETYRELQRGADRFVELTATYLAANLLQLLLVVALGLAGKRSSVLYLAVYGLSPVAVVLPLLLLQPLEFAWRPTSIARARLIEIGRFVLPVLVQSVCFAIWFGADVVLLRRTSGLETTAEYGAAKTLTFAILMPATALAQVLMPRAAAVPDGRLRVYIARMLGLTAVATVPVALAITVLGGFLATRVFGETYRRSADVLPVIAIGMTFAGIYLVASRVWIGRARPTVDLAATATGMVVTLASGLLLVPSLDMVGAGTAFAFGAAIRLVVIVAYSMLYTPDYTPDSRPSASAGPTFAARRAVRMNESNRDVSSMSTRLVAPGRRAD
ncbi:MAG: oligosaccharide flippase family protein [Dehalococcoidia bacterium]